MTRQPMKADADDDGPKLTLVPGDGAARTGNLRRLADSYLRQRRFLGAFIGRWVGDPDAREDLLNDIWLRIGRLEEEEAPREPDAYLRTVAKNLATDWLRRRTTRAGVLSEAADVDQVPDWAPRVDDVIVSKQALDYLLSLIENLAPRQRQALLLYRVDGWTMAKVAQHMGISVRTVEEHVSRAIAHCDYQMTKAGWLP
jgi:RNA polymerase sigma factor (sigma-70 family)